MLWGTFRDQSFMIITLIVNEFNLFQNHISQSMVRKLKILLVGIRILLVLIVAGDVIILPLLFDKDKV